jgi:hypothetical protein
LKEPQDAGSGPEKLLVPMSSNSITGQVEPKSGLSVPVSLFLLSGGGDAREELGVG